MIELTLIAAAVRGGNDPVASAVVNERLTQNRLRRKPLSK
jgi:hypothetical protein